ncbi:MAG: hypothetical protein M4579_003643 [Chaenotheca gracillima]|nr:MAG: hypothetical protein M4579_003643 [Chaenotheca gracillima]
MAPTPPGDIPKVGMLAIIWIGAAVSTILSAARFWIRHTKLGRFFWDDAVHLFALLTLLTSAIIYCWMVEDVYNVAMVVKGLGLLDAHFFAVVMPRYFKYQFAIILLFWTTIWSVKISFLLFYRRFFDGLRKHLIAWWIVLIFTVGAFIGSCITFLTACGPTAQYFMIVQCGSPSSLHRMAMSIKFSTSVDILSDLMIMALPLRILWDLRVTTRQKIGLAGLFSLAIIIMTFSIVRAIKSAGTLGGATITSLYQADPTTLTLYTILESTIAVIVSCLPTFRVLFVKSRESSEGNSVPLPTPTTSQSRDSHRCSECGHKQHRRWIGSQGSKYSSSDDSRTVVGSHGSETSKSRIKSYGSVPHESIHGFPMSPIPRKHEMILEGVEEAYPVASPLLPLPRHHTEIFPKTLDVDKPLPSAPSHCSSTPVGEDEEAEVGSATAYFRDSRMALDGESYEAFLKALNK